MPPLHRHQLAYLTPAGWQRIAQRDWDATSRACLAHWATRRLPLVVTRQLACDDESKDTVALGLPAPGRWERRRIALRVPHGDVMYFDEFPSVEQVMPLLPHLARAKWEHLAAGLKACGATARVYGSLGWQHLSGLDHLRGSSDIDLWVAVSDPAQADAVAALLQAFSHARLWLDGELMFDGRDAVAWREWLAWRAGGAKALLVKTITGSSLSHSVGAHEAVTRAEALA